MLDGWMTGFPAGHQLGCRQFIHKSIHPTIRFTRVNPWFQKMKSKKKKVAFPRRTWQINPVTRVKSSAKKYSRPRVKQDLKKEDS
jgi:hypothetical protein